MQSNLHLVVVEMHALTQSCRDPDIDPDRVRVRLESALLVFAGEMRSIHNLLHRPGSAPPVVVLESILAGLSAALDELRAVTTGPHAPHRSHGLRTSLQRIERLTTQICADCVPDEPPPEIRVWMDRVTTQARGLA